MHKSKHLILVSISVIVLLIIAVFFLNTMRRSAHIQIDETDDGSSSTQRQTDIAPGQIAVTPETVQRVIATLTRPESYKRTVEVSYFWGEGSSGTVESTVAVMKGFTRIDTHTADGTVRHCITDGETSYLWYGTETKVISAASDTIGADDEQAIPTYEDVLSLGTEQIIAADYAVYEEENCVYVCVKSGENRTTAYYVSVASGLLAAAEQYEGETLTYRMQAEESTALPTAQDFILPDGRMPVKE